VALCFKPLVMWRFIFTQSREGGQLIYTAIYLCQIEIIRGDFRITDVPISPQNNTNGIRKGRYSAFKYVNFQRDLKAG